MTTGGQHVRQRHAGDAGGAGAVTTRDTHGAGYSPVPTDDYYGSIIDYDMTGAPELPAEIVHGQVHIVPRSISAELFTDEIRPPTVVNVLPTLPDDTYPQGSLVFLTTDEKLWRNTDGTTWSVAVAGEDIIANSITAGQIAAGAIGADQLQAEIVLASLIKTAEGGAHLELDAAGFRAFDSAEELLVNIPTNDDPVYVSGELQATQLFVPGHASFLDTISLEPSSVATLELGISTPAAEPTVTPSNAATTTLDGLPVGAVRVGGFYDPVGGVDGATPCFASFVRKNDGTIWIYEWTFSTGVLNRSTQLTGSDLLYGHPTRIGTSWYICGNNGPTVYQTILYKFTRSSGAMVSSDATISNFVGSHKQFGYPIKTDGTDLFVLAPSTTDLTDGFALTRWDTNIQFEATIELTEPALPGGVTGWTSNCWNFEVATVLGNLRAWVAYVNSGGTTWRRVYEHNITTGALISNTDFTLVFANSTAGGLVWDGTQFWAGSSQTLAKYTNLVGTNPLWFGYSWYDSVGTAHETVIGPSRSVTAADYRRRALSVTTPTVPGAGGADDPDNSRVYALESASDPADNTMRLQATIAGGGTVLLTTIDTGSAVANGGTAFPDGTPARIQAAGGEWALHADGLVEGIPPAGSIVGYGGVAAPVGWLLCQGQSLLRADYPALFAVIGVAFGSVDGTHFTLPDLRGRFPIGKAASGTGSTLGGVGGEINHNHTGPSHDHSITHTHTSDPHSHPLSSAGRALLGFAVGSTPSVQVRRVATGFTATHSLTGMSSSQTNTGAAPSSIELDGNTDSTTPAPTGGSSAANTGLDGTGATGTENPPFQAVNYIIKT